MIHLYTPVLISGSGAAPLVVAKLAAGAGLQCLLAGHVLSPDESLVALSDDAMFVLEVHGLVNVLLPYVASKSPLLIAPRVFEEVVKLHCVADVNVVVYDDLRVSNSVRVQKVIRGTLTNGFTNWSFEAEQVPETADLPSNLSDAVVAADRLTHELIDAASTGD